MCVCVCVASMVNNVTVTLACDGYDGPVASHAHDSTRRGHARGYGETTQTTTATGALDETESAGNKSRGSTTDASVVRARWCAPQGRLDERLGCDVNIKGTRRDRAAAARGPWQRTGAMRASASARAQVHAALRASENEYEDARRSRAAAA